MLAFLSAIKKKFYLIAINKCYEIMYDDDFGYSTNVLLIWAAQYWNMEFTLTLIRTVVYPIFCIVNIGSLWFAPISSTSHTFTRANSAPLPTPNYCPLFNPLFPFHLFPPLSC